MTSSLWLVGTGAILGGFFLVGMRRLLHDVAVKRRRRRGVRLERRAEKILRRHGYHLEEVQPELTLTMTIDGKPMCYSVRPDGVASRKGCRYLVEVKSGPAAGNIHYPATRRQLLEYRFARPDLAGVLFVNADRGYVRHIDWSVAAHRGHTQTRLPS